MQKFYKIIFEIIVSKTECEIFWAFCLSNFINNFMVKNSFSEPKNQQKLNTSRPVYFLKNFAHRFVGVICTNKLKGLFSEKNFFFKDLELFYDCNTTNLDFLTFFQGWLFNFNIILKTHFKNLFRKTAKKGWFYSFK